MSIFSHFKAKSLADEYVGLVIQMQAIQSVKQLFQYDNEISKALNSLQEETTAKTKEIIDRVKLAGPSVASKWRILAKERLQNTKESALLAPLEAILTKRLGVGFQKSLAKNVPEELRKKRIDGMMIRLFELIIDKVELPT